MIWLFPSNERKKEKHLRKHKHHYSKISQDSHSRNRRYGNSYRVANVRMLRTNSKQTIKIYIWSVIVKWPKTTVNNYHHHRHYHHDNGNDDGDDNLYGVALFGNATLDMKPLEQHLKPFTITVVVTFASASLMWRSYSPLTHLLSDFAWFSTSRVLSLKYSTQPNCEPREWEWEREEKLSTKVEV